MKPINCYTAITYRCNSKCLMCNIWKLPVKKEIEPELYGKLPPSLKTINISGGEPFLRSDVVRFIEAVEKKCNSPRIVVSTNGFLTKTLEEKLKEILSFKKDVAMRISLDGMNGMHEKIRGIKGGFDKALKSVDICKNLGVKDLGVAFTISDTNVTDLLKVYNLANDLKIQFTITIAHNSEIQLSINSNKFTKVYELKEQIAPLVTHELASWHPKRWFRAYYDSGVFDVGAGHPRRIKCEAGESFFFIDAYGDIFPCPLLNMKMGNLIEKDFDEIWYSDEAFKIRKYVKTCPRNCWMVCTVAPAMEKHPWVPSMWVLKNKLRLFLGKDLIGDLEGREDLEELKRIEDKEESYYQLINS